MAKQYKQKAQLRKLHYPSKVCATVHSLAGDGALITPIYVKACPSTADCAYREGHGMATGWDLASVQRRFSKMPAHLAWSLRRYRVSASESSTATKQHHITRKILHSSCTPSCQRPRCGYEPLSHSPSASPDRTYQPLNSPNRHLVGC